MILDIPPKVGAYSRREIADIVEKELREFANAIESTLAMKLPLLITSRDAGPRDSYSDVMLAIEVCMFTRGIMPRSG
jgi:hypothetical protein